MAPKTRSGRGPDQKSLRRFSAWAALVPGLAREPEARNEDHARRSTRRDSPEPPARRPRLHRPRIGRGGKEEGDSFASRRRRRVSCGPGRQGKPGSSGGSSHGRTGIGSDSTATRQVNSAWLSVPAIDGGASRKR